MGLKGKLIASLEVRGGGHLIFDIYHTNTHRVSNISPSIVNNFEIHEGETVKVGSIVSWNYSEGNTYFSLCVKFSCINFLYLKYFVEKKVHQKLLISYQT